jgi:5-amino-6-(5-phospho-D-ribitylamino)uracil phosphatase
VTARYDMLALDLDGTLLAPDGSISGETVAAVARAREAGIEVIVATGRALVESRGPLDAIGHEGLVIAAGGSMLSDASTGATLCRSAMPPDLVEEVTIALLGHDHKVLLLKDPRAAGYDYLAVGSAELDPASAWWFEVMPVSVRFVPSVHDDPHPVDTVRVGVVASASELAPIAERLKDDIGDRGFLQHWGAVTATYEMKTQTHLLEVFNPRVNKWTMMQRICAQRGVPPARVAAIGDGLNDVELIEGAGLGVAMGNADPRVTAVADRATARNTEDGAALAILAIAEGRW